MKQSTGRGEAEFEAIFKNDFLNSPLCSSELMLSECVYTIV